MPSGLTYELVPSHDVEDVARINWTGTTNTPADEILRPPAGDEEPTKAQECADILKEILSEEQGKNCRQRGQKNLDRYGLLKRYNSACPKARRHRIETGGFW